VDVIVGIVLEIYVASVLLVVEDLFVVYDVVLGFGNVGWLD